MLQYVDPHEHWYTHRHQIVITIWPKWLAQLFCKHKVFYVYSAYTDFAGITRGMCTCQECHKYAELPYVKLGTYVDSTGRAIKEA